MTKRIWILLLPALAVLLPSSLTAQEEVCPSEEVLSESLFSADASERQEGLRMLAGATCQAMYQRCQGPREAYLNALEQVLSDSSINVRRIAANVLLSVASHLDEAEIDRLIYTVLDLVSDVDEQVRDVAVMVLGQWQPADASITIALLDEMNRTRDPQAIRSLILALGLIHRNQGVGGVNRSNASLNSAVETIRRVARAEWEPRQMITLSTRRAAIVALGHIKDPRVLPDLQAIVRSSEIRLHQTAYVSMASFGDLAIDFVLSAGGMDESNAVRLSNAIEQILEVNEERQFNMPVIRQTQAPQCLNPGVELTQLSSLDTLDPWSLERSVPLEQIELSRDSSRQLAQLLQPSSDDNDRATQRLMSAVTDLVSQSPNPETIVAILDSDTLQPEARRSAMEGYVERLEEGGGSGLPAQRAITMFMESADTTEDESLKLSSLKGLYLIFRQVRENHPYSLVSDRPLYFNRLRGGLESPNADVRYATTYVLGELGDIRAIRPIVRGVLWPFSKQELETASTLPGSERNLIRLCSDTRFVMQRWVRAGVSIAPEGYRLTSDVRTRQVREEVANIFSDDSEGADQGMMLLGNQLRAVEALGRLENEQVEPALNAILTYENPTSLRGCQVPLLDPRWPAAIEAMGRVNPQRALRLFLPVFRALNERPLDEDAELTQFGRMLTRTAGVKQSDTNWTVNPMPLTRARLLCASSRAIKHALERRPELLQRIAAEFDIDDVWTRCGSEGLATMRVNPYGDAPTELETLEVERFPLPRGLASMTTAHSVSQAMMAEFDAVSGCYGDRACSAGCESTLAERGLTQCEPGNSQDETLEILFRTAEAAVQESLWSEDDRLVMVEWVYHETTRSGGVFSNPDSKARELAVNFLGAPVVAYWSWRYLRDDLLARCGRSGSFQGGTAYQENLRPIVLKLIDGRIVVRNEYLRDSRTNNNSCVAGVIEFARRREQEERDQVRRQQEEAREAARAAREAEEAARQAEAEAAAQAAAEAQAAEADAAEPASSDSDESASESAETAQPSANAESQPDTPAEPSEDPAL